MPDAPQEQKPTGAAKTTSAKPCVCCLHTEAAPALAGLLRCAQCGHVYADMTESPELFKELYTRNYFKGGEYADYEQEEQALRLNFRRRVRELAARHPSGATLWEIGCAYGFFLKEAASYFDAAGCDVAEDAIHAATTKHGVRAHCLDYLRHTLAPPRDVICLWDVIEHLPEPDLFLEKALHDLRPGGTLALSTGDIGSLCARLRGRHWRQIHPPTHIQYFTRHSMTTLLTRLGYANIEIIYPAFWRNMDTVAGKILTRHRAGTTLYRALHRVGLLHFNFPLNLYDLMTVYARKPE